MAKSVKHTTFAFNEKIRCKNRALHVFGQETGTLIFCRTLLNIEEREACGGWGGVIFLMLENWLLLLCADPVSSTK